LNLDMLAGHGMIGVAETRELGDECRFEKLKIGMWKNYFGS